ARRGDRLLETLAAHRDLGPVAPRRLDLGHRRVLRDEDRRSGSSLACRPRDRLRVVPGARGDDAVGALRGLEGGELVDGAADLERAGALEVLGLQVDRPPDEPRERLRAEDGRDPRDAGEPLARLSELSCAERRRHRSGTPSRRSPARPKADRAPARRPRPAAGAARDPPPPPGGGAPWRGPTRPRRPRRTGSGAGAPRADRLAPGRRGAPRSSPTAP